MKAKKNRVAEPTADEMRPHYDFDYSKSRPNRFARPKPGGVRSIVLDPDVAEVFHSSDEVNEVRIVRKGRMRVAVPLEEGTPLRSDGVRKTTSSLRTHRR
jgi:hypothetical protein